MGFETQDVEQKVVAILNSLGNSKEVVGSRVIAQRLKERGIELSERSVRYHLRLMDEKGLTKLVSRRDGRMITEFGLSELKKAMVTHKIGSALSRIEMLAFRTTFDWIKKTGSVPVNVSFYEKKDFEKALRHMKPVFKAGFCVSDLVKVAGEGERIGDLTVPEGKIGIATVCSIVVNGTLLKAGVPMDSKFGGILQMRDRLPLRFVEIINYDGSSLDPTEIFIRANMTTVGGVIKDGNGDILANYREVPAICKTRAEEVKEHLESAGIHGMMLMGNVSEPVCEIPIEVNRIGIVLVGGLNPVAAAAEAGITSQNYAMSTVVEYQELRKVFEIDERS